MIFLKYRRDSGELYDAREIRILPGSYHKTGGCSETSRVCSKAGDVFLRSVYAGRRL